jgi:Zn-dependent protease with chaperone function
MGATSNLERAKARLNKSEAIRYPVIVVESQDIGRADSENGRILLNTYAQNNFSEAELAFIIAHEEAHIDQKHKEKMEELIDVAGYALKESVMDKNTNFVDKIIQAGLITAVTFVSSVATSKLHELDSDLRAQQRMLDAGYSKEDTLRLAEKYINQPGKLISAHPSWKIRKIMLE